MNAKYFEGKIRLKNLFVFAKTFFFSILEFVNIKTGFSEDFPLGNANKLRPIQNSHIASACLATELGLFIFA